MTIRELWQIATRKQTEPPRAEPKPAPHLIEIEIYDPGVDGDTWTALVKSVPRINESLHSAERPDQYYTVTRVSHYFSKGKHYINVTVETNKTRFASYP